MAGRIREDDVSHIRHSSRIDDVVGDYVQLKNAGGGQKKGLCPFHDEKSPSFHVTPSKGFYHCFGCQSGGDVISFVMKIEHMSFTEAVERLADRMNYQLTYDEGPTRTGGSDRKRLLEANRLAALFYQEQLQQPGPAQVGREFLQSRGFDKEAAAKFGVGYAPDEWDALSKHLKGRGFTDAELELAGLTKEGQRGHIDRFRNRLVWPIHEISGDVVGFGARRLSESDTGPKYLNTPETPIYKKSALLYGLEMAKKEIAKKRQVVVVEGYTDVMAAHLAGIETAVATCGTAFGDEHIRILRRLLMDDDAFRGEVIFTFDGDAAGQKAALRAFDDDQKFVSQTFVAVEERGLDPCDLRIKDGDGAVRDLIARRVPLFEFAIKSKLKLFNLTTAEGRVSALKECAPLIMKIRDKALRPEYVRALAGWIGIDIELVREAVGRNPRESGGAARASLEKSSPTYLLEREVLKSILQFSELSPEWKNLAAEDFSDEAHQSIFALVASSPESLSNLSVLIEKSEPEIAALITELTVEPLRSAEPTESFISSLISRVREVSVTRKIAELKSSLLRLDPESAEYGPTFAELIALEAVRRTLHAKGLGEALF
ncbi:MAG: DNA primase [Candidatus Nanopelagicaceae bacterium]